MSPRSFFTVLPLSSVVLVAACKPLGPNHEVPGMKLPASFSNGGVKWKKQSPDSLPTPRAWWKLYGDGTLNSLIGRALDNNQELAGASARVRQARSLSAAARGRYFPTIDLNPSATRSKSRFQGEESIIQRDFSVPAKSAARSSRRMPRRMPSRRISMRSSSPSPARLPRPIGPCVRWMRTAPC